MRAVEHERNQLVAHGDREGAHVVLTLFAIQMTTQFLKPHALLPRLQHAHQEMILIEAGWRDGRLARRGDPFESFAVRRATIERRRTQLQRIDRYLHESVGYGGFLR